MERRRREKHQDRTHAVATVALLAIATLGACKNEFGEIDAIYYGGGARSVHCATDLDSRTKVTLADIDDGLDRARDRGEAIELYAHKPGVTVDVATLEHVFAGARDRGLRFLTYRDLASEAPTGPAIAFGFDDASVDLWWEIRPMLQAYDARITFFVSRFDTLDEEARARLHVFEADGHDIEAHSVNHLHAPDYVEQNGLGAYMEREVLPSIEMLRTDGFDPIVYAYPFGQRTSETDRAILAHVSILRSVSYAWSPVNDPCPE